MNIVTRAQALPLVVGGLALLSGSPAHATNCAGVDIAGLGVPDVLVDGASVNGAGACVVLGRVTTTGFGAPDGSAKFQATLPPAAVWNKKFVQLGQGGFAGSLTASTNAADPGAAAAQNYATAITDTGHSGTSTDASWALLSPGVPDEAKLTDYYFRAVHEVAVAMKDLITRFYASPLERAYFDGIISGDPFMDIRTILGGVNFDKIQLASRRDYIPASKLPMIDAAVYRSCDAADGVVDHLIQNPAKCSFDPKSLVTPSCTTDDPTCLTKGQANTLAKYLTALRDDDGHIVYTGQTVSDLAAGPQGLLDFNLGGTDFWTTGATPPTQGFDANEPWDNNGFSPSPIGWQFTDHFIRYVVERDPGFDMRSYVQNIGRISDDELALFDQRSEAGDGDVPANLLPFIERGKKLILYHGTSDPALAATRTMKYYEDLAEAAEMSFGELQKNVRLFMVPGMHHCVGGPGPDFFDTLTALDNWVEGVAKPDAILAIHFAGNTPPAIDRTMPLCKFPEEARYKGTGDKNDAANWICPARDIGMIEVGENGRTAGLSDATASAVAADRSD